MISLWWVGGLRLASVRGDDVYHARVMSVCVRRTFFSSVLVLVSMSFFRSFTAVLEAFERRSGGGGGVGGGGDDDDGQ